jgi:hypothetical protein
MSDDLSTYSFVDPEGQLGFWDCSTTDTCADLIRHYVSRTERDPDNLVVAVGDVVYEPTQLISDIGLPGDTLLFIGTGDPPRITDRVRFSVISFLSRPIEVECDLSASLYDLKADLKSRAREYSAAEPEDISFAFSGAPFLDNAHVHDLILAAGNRDITAAFTPSAPRTFERANAGPHSRPMLDEPAPSKLGVSMVGFLPPDLDSLALRTSRGTLFHLPGTAMTVSMALQQLSNHLEIDVESFSIGPGLPRGHTLTTSSLRPDTPFFPLTISPPVTGFDAFGGSFNLRPTHSDREPPEWRFVFKDREDHRMAVPWDWKVLRIKHEIGRLVDCPWHRIDLVMNAAILDETAIVDSLDVGPAPLVVVAVCRELWSPGKINKVAEVRNALWLATLEAAVAPEDAEGLNEVKRYGMTLADVILVFLRADRYDHLVEVVLSEEDIAMIPLS